MSNARHHADWLSLVEVSGPFVSLPVLMRTFPQGLEPRDAGQAKVLRAAYEDWHKNPAAPGKQRAWVMHVLTSLLGYPNNLITEGQTLPPGLEANMAVAGETLRPDFALVAPAGATNAGQAQMLIASYPAEQDIDKPVIGKHWKATPATRMMELLHAANVPLGLVTNGEQWMLVYSPRGETTGYASWYGALWLDEPITLRAFHSLLGVRRFFGVAADSTLLALLQESANDQQEVTDQLGYQVREAVEVLVQAFDALDQESKRKRLAGIAPTMVYDAALTLMMRLVFLFSAEERGLLHLGKPLYDDNYAVSTLQEQLQEVADRYGEEVLERRYDAWIRLLATFRAVHGGTQHQDLLMLAYGGSLFDPDRFPFLEGRAAGTDWRSTPADPLAVNNRVVLHLLNSLQRLRTKAGGGGAETRRVSFRALGVEQIGHVYEGLLDHTAARATDVMLGIRGTRKKEPEIALSELEDLLGQGDEKLLEHLQEETGRSLPALRRELQSGGLLDEHRLLLACGNELPLVSRVRPFAGLIREDSFDRPWVVLPGSIFVTEAATRRNTGTHYTPPSLTEPIVQYTLEPLVYVGPADGLPKEQWTLKSPKEILALKVCDMAMGSGAFLVQACRYLAERLVEAWENEEKAHPGQVLITPDGQFSEGLPSERVVPADAAERIAIARRAVADRSLHGVDINPMAVEMAKLSMWLITIDRNRPFTFLDHAFKCGDSLLGITSLEQLENFSMRHGGGRQQVFATLNLWRHIEEAKKKREALETMPSDTPEQVAAKATLFAEAEEWVVKLHAAADVLVSVELKGLKGRAYEGERELSADHMMVCWARGLRELQEYAEGRLDHRRRFHWALAFPEVVEVGGFDAFIGNPPFLGGRRIRGTLGLSYFQWLTLSLYPGASGNADLCAFFFRRAFDLLKPNGSFGFVATNTISQADTRSVSLDPIVGSGGSIMRAETDAEWPGIAGVNISKVWVHKGGWSATRFLNDRCITAITSGLTEASDIEGLPLKLRSNRERAYVGSFLCGNGFVITPDEAASLLSVAENSLVVSAYLTGQDVNSGVQQDASRFAINFYDWPLSRDREGSWVNADDKQKEEWKKSGRVPKDYSDHVASDFPQCLRAVEERVKPERTRLKDDGSYALRKPLPQRWWIYADRRPALYREIQNFDRVLVSAEVSKNIHFSFCPTGQIFSHMLIVFPTNRYSDFALLQSWIHCAWAWEHCSTMRAAGIRYSPSDAVENFPFLRDNKELEKIGMDVYIARQCVMQARGEGLTKTYNRVHDPQEQAEDISQLRRLQREMDNAVASAYGWQELDLSHGFHETKQGIRFTISESARREVLDRLLTLNHQLHAEEVAAAAAENSAQRAKGGRKKKVVHGQTAMAFDGD